MNTRLVLDAIEHAIEHAIWTRQRDGITDLSGLIHHNDRGSPIHLDLLHRTDS